MANPLDARDAALEIGKKNFVEGAKNAGINFGNFTGGGGNGKPAPNPLDARDAALEEGKRKFAEGAAAAQKPKTPEITSTIDPRTGNVVKTEKKSEVPVQTYKTFEIGGQTYSTNRDETREQFIARVQEQRRQEQQAAIRTQQNAGVQGAERQRIDPDNQRNSVSPIIDMEMESQESGRNNIVNPDHSHLVPGGDGNVSQFIPGGEQSRYGSSSLQTESRKPTTEETLLSMGFNYEPQPGLQKAEPRGADPSITFADIQFERGDLLSMRSKSGTEKLPDQLASAAVGAVMTFPQRTAGGIVSLATDPVGTISKIPEGLAAQAKSPAGLVQLGTDLALTKGLGVLGRGALLKGRDIYISAGAKFVKPEKVIARSVLAGEENMPLVGNVAEAQRLFEAARTPSGTIKVSTASPSALSGNQAGLFGKAAAGLEDPGIYVTPKGQASPYFTGVAAPAGTPPSFSLNPVKGVFNTPTITTFEVSDVVRYPRGVIQQPGFAALEFFQRNVLAPKGKAVITKRSEIGLGEVPRQQFRVTADLKTAGGLNVRKGQLRTEAGTSELEAVIPVGSTFAYNALPGWLASFKGYGAYTTFAGRNIALRDAVVAGAGRGVPDGMKSITGQQIARETGSLSELISPSKAPPYSGLSLSIPKGSSMVSRRTSSLRPSRSSITTTRFSGVSGGSRTSAISIANPLAGGSGMSLASPSRVASPFGGLSLKSGISSPPSILPPTSPGTPSYPLSSGSRLPTFAIGKSLIPYREQLGERKRKFKTRKFKERGFYTPDIVSREFSIFGGKPRGFVGTGLELRMLPGRAPRKSKSRRYNPFGNIGW